MEISDKFNELKELNEIIQIYNHESESESTALCLILYGRNYDGESN